MSVGASPEARPRWRARNACNTRQSSHDRTRTRSAGAAVHRNRFGPVEWLWHSLTYWKWQPLRRE
ncbi:MAG: DUF418 domain-containing protein [Proteobacteria bacterium]|nr:DUF418 domain-containing protein [Pseudomonadota bacterium]